MITEEQAQELRRLMNEVIAAQREGTNDGVERLDRLVVSAARLSYYIDALTERLPDA